MLKMKILPIAMRVVSKIDLKPIIAAVKEVNDFTPTSDKQEAANQVRERNTELGLAIINGIIPQLDRISDDIIPFVAAYEDISEEEAGELDVVEELKKIAADAGVMNFFASALKGKVKARK